MTQKNKEIVLFEWYAKYVWKFHRFFVRSILSRRCTACALSEKASPLSESGVCEECSKEKLLQEKPVDHIPEGMEQEMDAMFASYAGKGKYEYDVAVMFSGGKDSCFLIQTLKEKYPSVRLLALTIDSGFMNPTALTNIMESIEKLKVPHLTIRPDPSIFATAFAYALTHTKGKGCAMTVDFVDGELFVDLARHVVARLRIPALAVGFSYEQITRYLHWNHFIANPQFEHGVRTSIADVYSVEEMTPSILKKVWWDASLYEKDAIATVLFPFYVWRYSEEEVKRRVVEMGLVKKGNNSPLQTNNMLIPLEGLVDQKTIGYSSWEPEFCHMIRQGKADRVFWRNVFELIEYSSKTGKFISSSVDTVLDKLSLTRKDVML